MEIHIDNRKSFYQRIGTRELISSTNYYLNRRLEFCEGVEITSRSRCGGIDTGTDSNIELRRSILTDINNKTWTNRK